MEAMGIRRKPANKKPKREPPNRSIGVSTPPAKLVEKLVADSHDFHLSVSDIIKHILLSHYGLMTPRKFL